MILYFLTKYFYDAFKRWMAIFGIIFVLSIIARYKAYHVFVPAGGTLMLWDYVFYAFSYPLMATLFFPLLFCYLTNDIFKTDFADGSVMFTLLRSGSRLRYYASKTTVIVIFANLFFLGFFCILMLLAAVFGLPVYGEHFFPLLRLSIENGQSITRLLVIQHGLLVLYLSMTGLLSSVISLIFGKASYAYIGIFFLAIQGYNAVMFNIGMLPYSIFAYSVRSHHYPFILTIIDFGDRSINRLSIFTTTYVICILAILVAVFFISGWHRFKNKIIRTED